MRPVRLTMGQRARRIRFNELQMAEPTGITAHLARSDARSGPMPGGNAGRRLPARLGLCRRVKSRRGALPLVLLLLALSALFLFGGDREHFYRGGLHDWDSSKTLALAENLSFKHNLLVFYYQSRAADGSRSYPRTYNRFPTGGFALVKLAILPFGDTDFQAKTYAARLLMLLLFSAAAVLAYHALARIAGSRWDALTATLLAFSSYYVLYYSDMILTEITIDLFGVMLAFHGMVVFVQEGRFRQLLVKSGVALLLGWHLYAFLLPFIIFGLAAELVKAHQSIAAPRPRVLRNLKCYASTLLRSRYLLLGIVTLLFGVAILAFNFGNEYFALDGAVPFRELPSVSSASARLSGDARFDADYAKLLAPAVFWPNQFYRIAVMTLPYAVNPYEIQRYTLKYRPGDYPAIVGGVLALGVCLAGLVVLGIRRRPGAALLLATLTAAGFCWAVLVRHNVIYHDFETVFYIGIPLAAFTLALLGIRRQFRTRLSPYLAMAALAVFALSVSGMAGVGDSRAELAKESAQMADYTAIRAAADDPGVIYVPMAYRVFLDGDTHRASYYLAGKTLVYKFGIGRPKPQQAGDYLMLPLRVDSPALLTPDNSYVYLYDWALYEQWQHRLAQQGRPIIPNNGIANDRIANNDANAWRVYLGAGHLTYQSPECARQDAPFFLHFTPRRTADLSAGRREYGYDNHDFNFEWGGVTLSDGTCVMERPLPDYDLAAIRTGQHDAGGPIWAGEYRHPAP